jgi:hypothetical protein
MEGVMSGAVSSFLLVGAANAIPLLTYDLCKARWAWPVDGGRKLKDGHRLFGPAKTIRGVVLSLLFTPALGLLIGFPAGAGLLVAAGAMAGDLLSSFIKRRMGMKAGSMAFGLDQVPEILIPLLLVRRSIGLSGTEIAVSVAAFIVFELIASRLLFKVHLREHPY